MYDLLSGDESHQPLPVLDAAKPVAPEVVSLPHSGPSAGGGAKLGENNDIAGLAPFSHGESRVVGLSVHRVDQPEAVMQLLRQGDRNRRVSSTIVSFVRGTMPSPEAWWRKSLLSGLVSFARKKYDVERWLSMGSNEEDEIK